MVLWHEKNLCVQKKKKQQFFILTGGEANRQEGELPQELPDILDPEYVGTGTGQAEDTV